IGYTPRRSWRGGRLQKWILLVGGLLLLTWAAPMIAAHTPLRNMILGSVCGDINGTVTAGSASLGWFSPVVLSDVEIREVDGSLIAAAKTVTLHTSLLSLLTADNSYGRVDVQSPELHIKCAHRDTNLEAVLARYLDGPSTGSIPDAAIQVSDGAIMIDDLVTQAR